MPEFLALLFGFVLGMLAADLGRAAQVPLTSAGSMGDDANALGTGPGAHTGGRTMGTKAFEDLTDAEVAALTEDQITHYCDLRCAEAGVALPPPDPGPAPNVGPFTPDGMFYVIGGLEFRRVEDANRVHELLQTLTLVDVGYSGGGSYQRVIRGDEATAPNVVATRAWTQAGWEASKQRVLAANSLKTEHEARLKEYNDAMSARSACVEEIMDRLETARANVWRRERIMADFERYLVLADGDRTIAARFLRQAFPSSVDLVSDEDLGLTLEGKVS